jgi:glycosyltransferase involved in cell wall biosynthesis
LKIAVYHNQPSGGARRALFGFCRELGKSHQLDVYTLTTSDQDLLRDEDIAANVTKLVYSPRPPIRMGLWLNDVQLRRDLVDLDWVNQAAAALIDSGGYDVALVDACRFTYAPYVLRHLKTPAAYYCHHGPWRAAGRLKARGGYYDQLRFIWHLPYSRQRDRNLVQEDAALTRCARKVITNSEYSRSRIADEYGLDAMVCPPGVDLPAGRRQKQGNHVITIGALEMHKGHDLVIRALATIPATHRPELRLVANDGSPAVRRHLESLAARLSVRLNIRWRISDADLASDLSSALVFVYGAHAEPLGLGPLEAMAHRVPVVSTKEGGVLETVADGVTGFLCRRDPALIGGRVLELMLSEKRRDAMGDAGRKRVERHWGWATRAAALETELRRVGVGAAMEPAAR